MFKSLALCIALFAAGAAANADHGLDRELPSLVPVQQTYQCRNYNSLVACTRSCNAQLNQCYNRAGTDGAMQTQCEGYRDQCVGSCFSNYCN